LRIIILHYRKKKSFTNQVLEMILDRSFIK